MKTNSPCPHDLFLLSSLQEYVFMKVINIINDPKLFLGKDLESWKGIAAVILSMGNPSIHTSSREGAKRQKDVESGSSPRSQGR